MFTDLRPRSFNQLPVGVKNILILNALFFAASLIFQNTYQFDLSTLLGLYFPKHPNFGLWQFVTGIFMHANFTHIIMNMIMFYIFGTVLETYWGTKRFLFFYFFTGIGASLIFQSSMWITNYQISDAINSFLQHPSPGDFNYFIKHCQLEKYYAVTVDGFNAPQLNSLQSNWDLHPENNALKLNAISFVTAYKNSLYTIDSRFWAPCIGASGAVFGVLFAFGYLFPNTSVYYFSLFPIKAKYFVTILIAAELYMNWANVEGDNIAHLAHLGGALFAFLLVFYWNKTIKDSLF